MKLRSCMKMGGLIALGIVGSYFTSRLIAQAKPAADEAVATKVAGQGGAARIPSGSFPAPVTASFTLDEMTVTALRGAAAVDALVTIDDSRPGESYMWTIIVRGEDFDDILFTRNYEEQVFSSAPGRVLRPTFSESVELGAGTYHVELRLYEAKPGTDIDPLNESGAVSPQILLADNKQVIIR